MTLKQVREDVATLIQTACQVVDPNFTCSSVVSGNPDAHTGLVYWGDAGGGTLFDGEAFGFCDGGLTLTVELAAPDTDLVGAIEYLERLVDAVLVMGGEPMPVAGGEFPPVKNVPTFGRLSGSNLLIAQVTFYPIKYGI